MKKIAIIFSCLLLVACQSSVVEKVEETFEDKAKKVVSSYQVKGNKEILVGEKHFYPNGNVKMKGGIVKGKRHGKWEAYFENGKTQSVVFFEDGLRTDEVIVYYPSGNIMYKGFFKADKKTGLWKFYTKSGKLENEKKY